MEKASSTSWNSHNTHYQWNYACKRDSRTVHLAILRLPSGYSFHPLLPLCPITPEEGDTISIGATRGKNGHLLSKNGHPQTDTRGLSQNAREETKAR